MSHRDSVSQQSYASPMSKTVNFMKDRVMLQSHQVKHRLNAINQTWRSNPKATPNTVSNNLFDEK